MEKVITIPDHVKARCEDICSEISDAYERQSELSIEVEVRRFLLFKSRRYKLNTEVFQEIEHTAGVFVASFDLIPMCYEPLKHLAQDAGDDIFYNPFIVNLSSFGEFCLALQELISIDGSRVSITDAEAVHYNRLVESCKTCSDEEEDTSNQHRAKTNA